MKTGLRKSVRHTLMSRFCYFYSTFGFASFWSLSSAPAFFGLSSWPLRASSTRRLSSRPAPWCGWVPRAPGSSRTWVIDPMFPPSLGHRYHTRARLMSQTTCVGTDTVFAFQLVLLLRVSCASPTAHAPGGARTYNWVSARATMVRPCCSGVCHSSTR